MSSESLNGQRQKRAHRIRSQSRSTRFFGFVGDFRGRVTGVRTALAAVLAVGLTLGGVSAAFAVSSTPVAGPTAGGTTVTGDVPGVSFTQVSAGDYHSVALGDDGGTYTWGVNHYGQLGDGTNTDSNLPVRVQTPTGVTFTRVSAGPLYSVALGDDGNSYAWGYNGYGQLGDGIIGTDSNIPVRVQAPAGVTFTQISAGGFHMAALGDDGNAYAWGVNFFGALGDDTNSNSSVPVRVHAPAGVTFTQISAGYTHTVALGGDGNTYAWGDNADGQLGNGTSMYSNIPVKVQTPAGVTFAQINAGYDHTVVLGTDGNTYTWGANAYGQLGTGTNTDSNRPVQVQAPVGVTFTQINAGTDHTVALGNDGNAYAWGYNGPGGLGNGTTTDSNFPVRVQGPAGVTFTQISGGYDHTVALGDDGNVYAWGENLFGELGDGTNTNSSLPVRVAIAVQVTAVSFGGVAATNLQQTGGQWTAATPRGCGPVDAVMSYTIAGGPALQKTLATGFTYGTRPAVTTQPKSVAGVAGTQVTVAAAASGDTNPTVAWESSTDAGAVWTAVPQGTTPSLKVTVANRAVQYRAVFTNCNGTVTTAVATVTLSQSDEGGGTNNTNGSNNANGDDGTKGDGTKGDGTKDTKDTTGDGDDGTKAGNNNNNNSLASTGGVPGWPWLTAAGILLIAGIAVVITAARRRDRTHSL